MNKAAHWTAAMILAAGLQGCVAKSMFDLATTPIRTTSQAIGAASTTVDVLTVSQSERDEKRGRDMRKQEERLGRMDREYRRESARCADGDRDSCDHARQIYDEIQSLSTRPN